MAASTLTLSAELKFRDGRADKVDKINVAVENTLTSLIAAIHKMGENVSQLLSELVDKERLAGDCAVGEHQDPNCKVIIIIIISASSRFHRHCLLMVLPSIPISGPCCRAKRAAFILSIC